MAAIPAAIVLSGALPWIIGKITGAGKFGDDLPVLENYRNVPYGPHVAQIPGEHPKHVPGHNFTGPGTNAPERIRMGIKPTCEVDAGSMIHDISYGIISDLYHSANITEDEAYKMVRDADNALASDVKVVVDGKRDFDKSGAAVLHAMRIKQGLENMKLLDPLRFIRKSTIGKSSVGESSIAGSVGPFQKRGKRIRQKMPRKMMDREMFMRMLRDPEMRMQFEKNGPKTNELLRIWNKIKHFDRILTEHALEHQKGGDVQKLFATKNALINRYIITHNKLVSANGHYNGHYAQDPHKPAWHWTW